MKRTIKQEFQEAMDGLAFSQQDKAAITKKLLKQAQESPRSFSTRKLVALSLAAVLILSTMTAAAVYTRWPKGTELTYQFSEQEKAEAENSGLSVLPQETKPSPTNAVPQIVSATDQGITISVAQTLRDPYHALIVFRIEGFELPEGESPSADNWEFEMDGSTCHGYTARFFNGIVQRSPGVFTYADGSPIPNNADESTVYRYAAADGSLEYIVGMDYDPSMQPLNGNFTARCKGIGIADGLDEITLVEGNWELSWTITGSDKCRNVEINQPIGDTGFILRKAELYSLTALLEMEGDDSTHVSVYTGEIQEHRIPVLQGVMMKDGSFIAVPMTYGGGDTEIEENVFQERAGLQVVNTDQIESLVFYSMDEKLVNGKYIEGDPYIVPLP